MQPLSARETSVIGDFNGWNARETPMRPSADGTRLEVVIDLPPGRHAYRIVVDGEEQLDEFNMHRHERVGELAVNLVEVPDASTLGPASRRSFDGAVTTSFDGGAR
jgi:hypothetical protein